MDNSGCLDDPSGCLLALWRRFPGGHGAPGLCKWPAMQLGCDVRVTGTTFARWFRVGAAQVNRFLTFCISAIARLGFAARAVLYLCLGFLVVRVGSGGAGRPDFPGTLHQLEAAFGRTLVVALSCGFAGYAVWRWNEAGRNPEHRSIWARAEIAVRGAFHAWLALSAARVALGRMIETHPIERWTGLALSFPFGNVAVCLAAAGLTAFAYSDARSAQRGQVSTHLQPARLSPHTRFGVVWTSRLGMAARAIVSISIAVALFRAGVVTLSPNGVDMADIVTQVAHDIVGAGVVAAVGIGLMAYGVYLATLACWRHMPG